MLTPILPNRPGNDGLTSFAIAIGLLFMGTLLAGALTSLSFPWVPAGLVGGLLLGITGVARPRWFIRPYRTWNRIARSYTAAARSAVAWLLFHGVFGMVRKPGHDLRLTADNAGRSMWAPRKTVPAAAYGSLSGRPTRGPTRGWLGNLWAWSGERGKRWTLLCLPFLLVLRALGEDEAPSIPRSIYTLY